MNESLLFEARKAARADKVRQDASLRALHERALSLLSDHTHAEEVIEQAKAAIDKWERARSCSPYYIEEWRRILAEPVEGLRLNVLDPGASNGIALMHNTPFGFLLRKPAGT